VTQRDRRLEAPHRRLESTPPRIVEKAAVVGYKSASAVLARVPPRVSRAVIGTAAQGSYLLWPAKRRYSNTNFSRVLGIPPDDPAVRRLALRAYREYARYVVELMRLPSRPPHSSPTPSSTMASPAWRRSGESGRPLILVVGHVGNNEAVAAGLGEHGYPISVIADDSSFPELFDLLRRQREAWGVRLIPWRNLRDLYRVLRRNEILALLIDWGYRPDGIPVRLFDTWTTLPAGPATLAAKTGAIVVPVAIRRTPEGRFRMVLDQPIMVESADPAEVQRASQAIADALQRTIAAAPEQWYSFKPMWPADPGEARELEERASRMLAGGDVRSTDIAPGPLP
jgi:KDO2-lipid IV(A) lauroyltransferase